MARGDHLVVKCSMSGIPYEHHGIDMGDGHVIHLAPEGGSRLTWRDSDQRFAVRRCTREQFADGRSVAIVQHAPSLPPEEIADRANSMLGQTGYSLLGGNCEHFATLCATGQASSRQVEMGQATLAAVASASTKAFWLATGRMGTRMAVRGAVKLHPATLVADVVEMVTLAVGCQQGLHPVSAKRLARTSGNIAAVGLGALIGGPVGAGVFLAHHATSTRLADTICQTARRILTDHR